jgi:hypothetical protein
MRGDARMRLQNLVNLRQQISPSYIVQHASQEGEYGGSKASENAVARMFSKVGSVQKEPSDS